MARLGNQEVVEYYRNDSPAMVVRMECSEKKITLLLLWKRQQYGYTY